VDGGFAQPTVMGAAQPFAINRDDLAGRDLANGGDPTDKPA
jgi:hypothetical protein